ncbi:MAG TPA: hypothetical protein VFV87_20475 [Pirellulaceae bacterium]|nr:hypothetical protein [Pirellulaceae bacterium]
MAVWIHSLVLLLLLPCLCGGCGLHAWHAWRLFVIEDWCEHAIGWWPWDPFEHEEVNPKFPDLPG